MKKNIILLSFLTVMFAFFFAIPTIDNFSGSRVYSHLSVYDDMGLDRVGVIIENTNNISDINNKDFYKFLNKTAINNNIVIYIISTDCTTDNSSEVCIFVSTNETLFKNNVLLEKDYLKQVEEGITYSTYSSDSNYKILGFMTKTPISIRSILDYSEKGKYINIVNLDGDIVANIKSFMKELSDEYGQLTLTSPYTSSKSSQHSIDNEIINGAFSKQYIKFAISLVLIVLLCSKIFSYSRKISIMKIEGETSINIFLRMFLLNYIKYIIISFIVFIFFIFILYGSNSISFFTIIKITFLELLQLVLFSLVVSSLIFLIIFYTPIISSLKGSNYLDEVQYISYFIKFFVVFLIIPIISSTINNVASLIKMNIRHDSVYESLENQYSFGVQGSSGKYMSDLGKENFITLRDELAENGKLFEFSNAFFPPDNFMDFNPYNKDEYYSVDYFFLRKNNLDSYCNIDEVCIFVNKSNSDLDLKGKVNKLLRNPSEIKLIQNNHLLKTYVINDLLYQDYQKDLPLIYIPKEKEYDGQLNDSILIYNGTLEEVQKYTDTTFKKYGYIPLFNMSSRQAEYQRLYMAYNSLYLNEAIQFTTMILAYIFANRLLIEVDIDNNRKRYIISLFEGIKPYSINIYILKVVSPSILAVILNLLINRISFSSSILSIISVITIVELSLFFMFLYKHSNVRRFK